MQRYNQAIEKFAPKATRKVNPGDVFCIKLRDLYYWGRVMRTDAVDTCMGRGICMVVYIYKHPTRTPTLPANRDWSYSNLLLKPSLVGKGWWSSKYAYNVGINISITGEEANRSHYYLGFGTDQFSTPYLVDDYGNEQPFQSISRSQIVDKAGTPNLLHIAYRIDQIECKSEFFSDRDRNDQAIGRELRVNALEPYYKD